MTKVTGAVEALGYTVNQAARNLAAGRTGSIAFVVSERHERLFSDPNFGVLVSVCSRELRSRGQHLLVTTAQDAEEETFLGDYLTAGHVDGAIFALPHEGEDLLQRVARSALPVVALGRPLGAEEELSWVAVDDESAAFEAVNYLLSRGRSRVATITGPLDTSSGRGRHEGYRRALGKSYAPSMVAHGDWSPHAGRKGARKLLSRHPDIDAMFVACDLMALGAVAVLRETGRRIPEDVAVMGFDDSTAASMADPPLTTVHQPFERSAIEALAILDELIAGRSAGPRHVMVPTRLVRRRSA
jgi:DNA-binding LacI/PurR family transcriptional regulator